MPRDILLPGHKPVRHALVLETAPGVELPRLVAHPVRGFGGWTEVRPGEPFEFSTKYGTHLCAVQPGEVVPDRVDAAWCSAHASTPIPVQQVASLSFASPVEALTTTLLVEGVELGALRLRARDETRSTSLAGWAPIAVLALVALAGVVGLTWFVRRRNASAVRRA
jgi:hypothetical protein